MPSARTRIVIAEDHPLFREALSATIRERPDFELVGEAATGRAALDRIRELAPDVVVLDLKLPDLDGLQVLAALRRAQSPVRVVLLSAFLDGAIAYEAVAAGAEAYLSKDADRERVCDTIAAVARGETVLAPEIQAGIAQEIRTRGAVSRTALSPREQEVLALVAEGHSAPDIGKRLYLSPATVKGHLQSLYEKLGVSDRAAAVAEAMRRGLLE
ncbi:response regulator [Paraconexibacter sp.]|uniref:response regulator n=1 Tax=Paraconexibacter sp. TaxID=2949640 RepID=UPI003561A6D2